MQVIHTQNELISHLKSIENIAFVPTMGNLHKGHLAIIQEALKKNKYVVVSIFVNPLQFDSKNDFLKYPRTLDEDLLMLKKIGVPFVFAPSENDILNTSEIPSIIMSPIVNDLCGKYRPGHFEGVLTIVSKLFKLINPSAAYFGKKDFQQLFLIKDMVRQLGSSIIIVCVDTVRDDDGLAKSSRNSLLSLSDREKAPQLFQVMNMMKKKVIENSLTLKNIEDHATNDLLGLGWDVDYLAIRSSQSLEPPTCNENHLVILGAASLGSVRLIDNIEFCIQD